MSSRGSPRELPIDASKISPERFIRLAATQMEKLKVDSQPINTNENYVPVSRLTIGQVLISVDNVLEKKMLKRLAAGDLNFDAAKGHYVFKYDHGRSTMAKNDPIAVVEFEDGTLVIADGHHDYFLALATGATTVPIEIIRTYKGTGMSKERSWQDLIDRNLVYLPGRTAKQLVANPPRVDQVRDLPNRYLAALLALKVKTVNGELKVSKPVLPPIWIKVDDGIPFVEFHIADVLEKAGIRYRKSWQEKIPDKVLEAARRALRDAQLAGHPVLSKIPVIGSVEESTQLTHDSALLKRIVSEAGLQQLAPSKDGIEYRTTTQAPTIVIDNIHGDFKGLAAILYGAKIIDKDLNWIGGDTQLVLTGSYFSGKPHARLIMDLLMHLQRQAPLAGGQVHPLLGGDELKFVKEDLTNVSEKATAMFTAFPIEGKMYSDTFEAIRATKYGSWLASLNRFVVINKRLYTHEGVGSALLEKETDLSNVNFATRSWIKSWFSLSARSTKNLLEFMREPWNQDSETGTLSAVRVSASGKASQLSFTDEQLGKRLLSVAKDRFLVGRCAALFHTN